MDCREAREQILEMFDGSPTSDVRAHLDGCPDCAVFAASQTALDRDLSAMLAPPELSPNFRAALRGRIRREAPRLWPGALPDIVHVGSCLAATVACAVLLPFGAGPVLAIGVAATGLTYLPILAARIWLET